MRKSKRRVLAGIMSLLLLITSVFTGNVATVRAEGSVIDGVEDYGVNNVYVVTGDGTPVNFDSVLIPDGCRFVVEKAITVSGAIKVNPGGRLEVLGDGRITCESFSVGECAEGKKPSLVLDGIGNVPVIGGALLDLYESTDSGLSKVEEFEYFEFIYDYEKSEWVHYDAYAEFGPEGEYLTIVEVAVLGYDRGEGGFPISFNGVGESNTKDGGDRMKARVNSDSLTISWDDSASAKPLQICVEGANNGDWLIYNVKNDDSSYDIPLNRDGVTNYYVEVKYKSDYDLFRPDEDNPILVEVEYKNVPQEVNPSIRFQGVEDENYIDDGDRLIKARVAEGSATITWAGAATPTQICVQGAGENGDWLIHDVTGEETSYTISLNRVKEDTSPEDYYFVEVKYGPDSPSGNDITYETTSGILSDLAANNVTITGNSTVVTLNPNVRLRIDGTLSVGDTAVLQGTDHTSVLELGNKASIVGIDVYDSAGTKLSDESHQYTNSSNGAVELEWDSTNGYWKLRSSQGENHSIDVEFIPDISTLPSGDTSNFTFSIKGFQIDDGAVASVSDRVDFSKSSNGSHTFHLSVPDNAVKLGFSLSNDGKEVESASYKIGDGEEHSLTESEIGLLKTENGVKVQVYENDDWTTNITFKVKLTENSGNSDDITYNSNTNITSNLLKDNVTIAEGYTLTVDNCTLTIGQGLNVNSNASVVGTSSNSKLEFQPNASSNGIALFNTQGTAITGGQQVTFTNGSNITVFTWNASNSRWETGQAEESGNVEIIGNETKDVVIKFWKLKNGEYVQADISQFDRMGLNGKIFAAGELVDANYKVKNGGKASGINAFFFKGGFLNKITEVKLISSFTETDGKKTGVTINDSVQINEGEDEIFRNQQGVEEGRIKSPWRAELPVTEGATEEYNFLIIELQRSSIVWTGATESNYHGYGPDAYVENGRVQLVSVMEGETDLIVNKSADANADSYDLEKNEGYIFAPVGSTVTVRLVPDYGYQVIGAEINGVQSLIAGETVSTFSFVMPAVNVHFRGVFTPSTDKITTPASEVSSATIKDASNAASSGNLSLNVADNTTYTKTEDAKTTALGGDATKVATTVATLDMTLDNIVNKNTADLYWTTSVTDFTSPITVGLKLNNVTLADGEELVVVREHNGTLEKISATYNATTGTLSVPTNKFSTYSIVKLGKKALSDAVITFNQESFTYDGTEKEPTIKIDGVELDSSKFTVTYTNSSTSDGSKAKIFAGTVTVHISAKADNLDYTGTATKEFTIGKKSVTPSLTGTATKVYDNTTTVPESNSLSLTVTGTASSDTLTVNATGYAYGDAQVGTGKTIMATGIAISGDAAMNYELSGTTATIKGGVITQAAPTITLSNLSETTQAPTGVKATLTPADATATVKVEYKVMKTPAKAAIPEMPCNVTHEDTCDSKQEGKTAEDCNCRVKTHSHDEACGYKAAVPAQDAVYDWVTTRPTTPGTYEVHAYLPTETTNVAAIAVENAVTGTYTLTQYTPPAVNTPNNGSDTGSDNESSSSSSTSTTTTPAPTTPVVTEPVAEVTAPVATENATAEKPATTETTTKRPATTTEENEIETTPDETTGVSSEDGSEGWKDIKEEINDKITATGEEAVVVVEMNGEDTVPADIFENIKGQDITVTFDMGNGIVWAVNGKDVTGDSFEDINFSVSTGDGVTAIPAELISGLTEERFSMELTLEYEGEFGFTAVMSVNVDKENAGKYANLFYFNPETETMEFICSAPVKEDGTADLTFTHASDYVIVVDEVPLSSADNTSIDNVEQPVPEETPEENGTTEIGTTEKDVFNPLWIIVIGILVLLVGGIAILAVKKKNE